MDLLSQLQNQSASELREWVKQNQDDPKVIQAIVDQKEKVLPILLKNKVYAESLFKVLTETTPGLEYFLNECADQGFTPPFSMVEQVVVQSSKGPEIFNRLFKEFPSLPITAQFFISLLNQGLISTARPILLARPEFQKSDALLVILKSGQVDNEIADLLLANETVRKSLIKDFTHRSDSNSFPVVLVEKIIKEHFEEFKLSPQDLIYNYGNLLSVDTLELLLKKVSPGVRRSTHFDSETKLMLEALHWSPKLETLDERLLSYFKLKDVPEGSKFREQYVIDNPDNSTDTEILELINSSMGSTHKQLKNVIVSALKRSFTLVKNISLDQIEEAVPPVSLTDAIGHCDENHEKSIYFYKALPGKYRTALYKIIPEDLVPKVDQSRKKSYFFEAFEAIKRDDIESFREALSHGYDLNNFQADTHQSSKQRSCEMVRIGDEFLKKFNKEEMVALCQTPFSLSVNSYYGDDEERLDFSFKLDLDEAQIVKRKINIRNVFLCVADQVSFILSEDNEDEEIANLGDTHSEYIFSRPELVKAYLKRIKKFSSPLELDEKLIKELGVHLTASEIQELMNLSEVYNISDYLNLKGKDGQYIISYDELSKYMNSTSSMEDESFLKAMAIRDPEYIKGFVDAYLKGNKELTVFFGKKINIRRTKIDFFENFKVEINSNPQEIVDRIFANGGKWEEFDESFIDAPSTLKQFGDGRVVNVDSIPLSRVENFNKLANVKVNIQQVRMGIQRDGYEPSEIDPVASFITINELVVGDNFDLEEISGAKRVIELLNPKTVVKDESAQGFKSLYLAHHGIVGNPQAEAETIFQNIEFVESLNLENIKILENYGLMVSTQFVEEFLNHHVSDKNLMQWLGGRVGDLSSYLVSDEKFEYAFDENVQKYAESLGLKVIPEKEYFLMTLKETLKNEGVNFQPVDASSLSLPERVNLIKFIETEIDPNYAKLNLVSLNLDEIDLLMSYRDMRDIYSLEDSGLIDLFSLPPNLQTKKYLKGLRDLISLSGGRIASKITGLKVAVEIINPAVQLETLDFVSLESASQVEESESLAQISYSAIVSVEDNADLIKNNSIFLKGAKKSNILRFLRTCSEYGDEYINDIFSLLNKIVKGSEALVERQKALMEENDPDLQEQIDALTNSINGINSRLAEVAGMDDATHMHDRLMTLAAYLKDKDVLEPLGQDKFRKFEKSKELESSLGYQLFFPKTRAELQWLGETYGWCVSHVSSYGDNVINKGNLIFGICEKGKPSQKEHVVALAHFLHKGDGHYSLDQLRWSEQKAGRRNEDATGDFKYSAIISEIKEFLKTIKKVEE